MSLTSKRSRTWWNVDTPTPPPHEKAGGSGASEFRLAEFFQFGVQILAHGEKRRYGGLSAF